MVSRVPAAQDKHTTPGGRLGRKKKKKIKRKKIGTHTKRTVGRRHESKRKGV